MSSRVPSAGALAPTLARQIIEPLWVRAMAAAVPRVSVRARAPTSRSATFRSDPSELNSYWTVVEAPGWVLSALSDAAVPISKVMARS
ncbi:MAG TPA: hypothetical protein VMO80_10515 [Terriglobales bacterium]|nr:hypothetical protein [Terriglobales bacterium]